MSTFAGQGPENIFLVVNPDSPESLTVANHYCQLRDIPASNVFHLKCNPQSMTATAIRFRDRILKPILTEIDKRDLANQINQIVYSTHFPFRIDFRKQFPDQAFPKPSVGLASLTGATYLYQFCLVDRLELFSANNNFYCDAPQAGVSTSLAFTSSQQWSPGGKPVENGGLRYFMSTALGVTFRGGNSVDEMLAYLRRAKAADGSRPDGTVYYMSNSDVRSRARTGGYAAAAAELKQLGVKAALAKGVLPSQTDVIGVTTGAIAPNARSSGTGFMPGALVDNLTSLGARFDLPKERRKQTLVSHYLREGAAGASGTVIEPFLILGKFPQPTLHVHYARGCSLAEAFYRSVEGPYQLMIVGDPLCQPWAIAPTVEASGMDQHEANSGVVRIQPQAHFEPPDDPQPIDHFELFVDGVRRATCLPGGTLDWDTRKVADGFHRVVVVSIDAAPVRTQGRWSSDVLVDNGDGAVELRVDKRDPKTLHVASSGDDDIGVWQHHREIGSVSGGRGEIKLDPQILGSGPVVLQGRSTGQAPAWSRPLQVDLP